MDRETRRALIDQYKDGYRVVAQALEGATDGELDAIPAPGKWSARAIVHHLADSEMTSAVRLRLLIAMDRPEIVGYDQDAFARRLYYDRPIATSLEALRVARLSTAEILDRMSEDDWARAGTHTEVGLYGATDWLQIYGRHAHDHAQQILRARQCVGRTTGM